MKFGCLNGGRGCDIMLVSPHHIVVFMSYDPMNDI